MVLVSCKKAPETESKTPAPTTENLDKNPGEAIQVRYKASEQKLRKDTQFSISVTSGGTNAVMSSDLTATLALSQASQENIKIAYQINEVRDLQLSGGFKPKDAKIDLKKLLSQLNGGLVISPLGKPDAEGSKALSENQTKSGEQQKDELRQWVSGFLGFPELPEIALTLGKPTNHQHEEEFPLPDGRKVPIEQDSTYTLVKIDEIGGSRIAEINVETEGSGALEIQQDTISVDYASQGVLKFNLDAQIPVSLTIEETQTITAGSQGGAEFAVKVAATFTPT